MRAADNVAADGQHSKGNEMRIVVVGAGVVGSHVAERLSGEGHDISIVDADADLVHRLGERMDVMAVAGDAGLPSVLRNAGVEEADLLIAVTQHDTTNLLVSLMASKMGAKKRIVRVRANELSSSDSVLSKDDVGADYLINSQKTTLDLLERLVRNPGATDVWEFADGELLLWGYDISDESPLINMKLKDLAENYQDLDALIVAIARPDGIVIPTGDDVLLAHDNIYAFIKKTATDQFRRIVHPEKENIHKVVISGATRLGIALAERLESSTRSVVLVDPSRDAAEHASRELRKTMVLCGDISEPGFCDEAGLDDIDYFLALTDDDQANLVNSLLVRKRGGRRIGILAQQPQFMPILQSLDIDVVVNPRLLIVSSILRHIRKGRILQVSAIGETGAEAREYLAGKGSSVVGRPIKALGVPRGAILGALFRGDTFVIPRGDTVIEPDDRIVIFALPEAIEKVERLFARTGIFKK